jgi:hypothetical protein
MVSAEGESFDFRWAPSSRQALLHLPPHYRPPAPAAALGRPLPHAHTFHTPRPPPSRTPVPCEGPVEAWMTAVEGEMRRTLATVTKEGVFFYAQTPRSRWIADSLGMVTLAGSQVGGCWGAARPGLDGQGRSLGRWLRRSGRAAAPRCALAGACQHAGPELQPGRPAAPLRCGGRGRRRTCSGACARATSTP